MTHISASDGVTVRTQGRVRPRISLPAAGIAIGLFVVARLAGAVVLALAARSDGRLPLAVLGRSWDSHWYLSIASEGYGLTLRMASGVLANDLAFFPLYPALVRAVTELTPLSGGAAGLVVAWLAAAVAAWGVYAVGNLLRGRAVAVALVVLWGLLPHSIVLSMGYTEPLLTACAAWSLYAVLTGRWLWAGTLAALAGLTRPNGLAVAAAVVAAAAYEVWRARRRGDGVSHRLWIGAALAPLGWGSYVLWVGRRTGDTLGGYFEVQRLWGSSFDFGLHTVRFVKHLLVHGAQLRHLLIFAMAFVIVAAAVLLFWRLLADRAPLPLLVYSGVLLLIAVGGSGYVASKPRFILPAFPLLLPLAGVLARTAKARPWRASVLVAALAGLSFTYGVLVTMTADVAP
ncbi:hypothetical protein EJ357_25230 [Streptomyces cyaneochromogenes]|uniref:Glycosyltransferase RgtA/B/C/D-like domain-containing protein n=1 Tax=Streptomyces cyaneochromogenes TaxID=2496836 RepID=A0A3Q9EUK5_9ACTN|nr:hypothetical protein [Streptomyces cyaneochromogenes]AZQ36343.1 hypothetical protein EJ357_25230 [Streptomyces cyaneochromogenes]